MKGRRCPQCGSTSVARCRQRTVFEALILPLFLLRPFRCLDCYNRYYGYLFSKRVKTDAGDSGVPPSDRRVPPQRPRITSGPLTPRSRIRVPRSTERALNEESLAVNKNWWGQAGRHRPSP